MAKTMGTVAMLRASRRLENKLEARGRVLVWIARVVSGVIQGVGLLALLQLAGVWARPDGGDASTYWMWVLVAVALCGMISIFLETASPMIWLSGLCAIPTALWVTSWQSSRSAGFPPR